VLLPDTPIEAAAALAERMRHALATHPWPDPPGAAQSASFGVAVTNTAATLDALILRADRALLAAKSAGRDRVVVDTADGGDADRRAPEQLDSTTA
jgi:PleD family two-component response regulator